MSSLNVDEDQRWVPTHVQVTVVRGRGLRAKGKHGTSDVYTIIQVGKEKYSTCVVEKTTSPEWKEECSFELLPGVLEEDGERSAYPPGSSDLILTVMHRALIGDVFLGQAVIPLDKAFQDNICMKNEWFKLNSKTGKKEKERGEVQVTVQFTRNNLTASMYDLAMKDKHRSTFGKLKDRMKGKKRSGDEDSFSAIGPSGQLSHVRNRLPSDGGGEEDYEDDEGGEGRRSKMRSFFLRGKLRKSSDTRSSTSLGSESSESSSRGGSLSPTAGISVVVSDLSNSPSNSSNLTAENSPDHTADTSPKLSPLKCEFIDEAGEITLAVPQPSVYVNGNHVYSAEPRTGKPAGSLGPLQKSLPLSTSLQNLSLLRAEVLPKGPAGDGRRWSFDKAGEEEKAAIAATLEKAGSVLGEEEEEKERRWAQTAVSAVSAAESDSQGKKQRRNLFSHGRAESAGKGQSRCKDESEQAPLPAEERNKGWFGSKDSHSKPSLVVSPKLEPSSDCPLTPHSPDHSWSPPAPSLDAASWGSLLHHTNPFCHSQSTPPPMSPSNPFLSLLQCNPFYEDILADKTLKPALPPLSYLSSSDPQPPIATPSSRPSNPNPILSKHRPATEDGINTHLKEEATIRARRRPLPPIPSAEKNPAVKRPSNPFTSCSAVEKDVGWDSSFDAFAAGRMKSTEEPTIVCRPQPIEGQHTTNDPLLEDKGAGSLTMKTNQNMTVNYALHSPTLDATLRANTLSSLSEGNESNTENLARLAPISYTLPAHESTEADVERSTTTNPAANSFELVSGRETKPLNLSINTTEVTTNAHGCLNSHHSHSFPNPCQSLELHHANTPASPGPVVVGRLLKREEVHSSVSPYSTSEMLPATSSEEAEGQELDTPALGHPGISSHSSGLETLRESEDKPVMKPYHFSLGLGLMAQAQDDRNEELQEQLPSAVQKVILPCLQVEISSEDTLVQSPNLPPLYSMLSASSQPDCNNISLDVYRGENYNLIKDSINGCPEEVKTSISIVTDDVEAKAIPISEDEPFMKAPSFYIMTSSPSDRQTLWESTPSSTFGTQDFTNGPPKPERLLSDLLNTGHATTSLSQVFDEMLLHTKVSDRSPSSIFLSLYESADSQQYQSCRSYQSSKCSSISEEVLPRPRAETLASANSTVCEDEMFDELGEPQVATGSKGTVPLDLEEESEGSRTLDKGVIQKETLDVFHLERMREDEEKPVTPQSSLLIGDCFSNLETLSSALIDLCISPESGDGKVSEGEGENQALCSNHQCSDAPLPQFAVRQRSLSEGTLTTSFEDLTASFGSDPGINVESSSIQQSADPPPLTSSTPSLTAESSTPLAPSSLSISLIAAVRSSPSMAPATASLFTAKPVIGAPHAVLPQETQQAANQNSPHPVKPLTAGIPPEEKGRSVLASGLEKLKSTIHPGRSSQLSEPEPGRRKSLTEGAGSYYHLTHNELVSLLLQREAELERQKAEFARQGTLLVKREAELKKLKPQVRDLEDYIDTLLVRIMEQTPTLLQVRAKLK